MPELSKQIYKTPPLTELVIVAHLWLSRGYRVIPCQPGTKKIIAGFGPNLQDLTDAESLEYWFRSRRANLAVIPPRDGIILDFDKIEVYNRFVIASPEAAATYTEETPRGGRHLFLTGEGGSVLRGAEALPGLELKRIALVYPSQVQGRQYKPVNCGAVLAVNLAEALQGFVTVSPVKESRSGDPRPVVIPGAENRHPGGDPRKSEDPRKTGILAEIKVRWPILSYLAYFESGLKLTGSGRWRSGLCPWHKDRSPSLWVDTERNLWGCHACPAHGDIVNWHARRLHTENQIEAARDLARYDIKVLI